jgi:hypothetical protein
MEKNNNRFYTSRMCIPKRDCKELKDTENGITKKSSCCYGNSCNALKNLKPKPQKSYVAHPNIQELSVTNFTDQVLAVNTTWLVLLKVTERCESKSKIFETM